MALAEALGVSNVSVDRRDIVKFVALVKLLIDKLIGDIRADRRFLPEVLNAIGRWV